TRVLSLFPSTPLFRSVRVLRRDLRPADPVPFQTARLEQAAGRQLELRILEDTAEGPSVRGLGRLAPRVQPTNRRTFGSVFKNPRSEEHTSELQSRSDL